MLGYTQSFTIALVHSVYADVSPKTPSSAINFTEGSVTAAVSPLKSIPTWNEKPRPSPQNTHTHTTTLHLESFGAFEEE